eukprot:2852858-Prymnesium_polylepis.2
MALQCAWCVPTAEYAGPRAQATWICHILLPSRVCVSARAHADAHLFRRSAHVRACSPCACGCMAVCRWSVYGCVPAARVRAAVWPCAHGPCMRLYGPCMRLCARTCRLALTRACEVSEVRPGRGKASTMSATSLAYISGHTKAQARAGRHVTRDMKTCACEVQCGPRHGSAW